MDNPYKAPEAPLEVQVVEEPDEKVAKKIKNAWVAGVISASITVVFILISLAGTSLGGINAWSFFDVAVILALSYGIYRKSRTCAVLLFLVFLANKLIMWAGAGNVSGFPLALVFLYFFAQGIMGTFQYHKAREN